VIEKVFNDTFLQVYRSLEPTESYSVQEISVLSGCSESSIRRNLRIWRSMGIVESCRKKRNGRVKNVYSFEPKIVRVFQRFCRYVDRANKQV
jgi:predicted transcriptional regulator